MNIGITDSLTAELWGLRTGLLLAKSLDLQDVIVEMDAKVAIQFLQQGIPSTHHNATLVQEVLSLAREG